jgi:hypothetical protein
MATKTKRWKSVVTYKTKKGTIQLTHQYDELSELEEIIEKGWSFESIVKIETTYQLHDKGKVTPLEDTLSA